LWFRIYAIILDRSEGAKGKSMRQLLGVLVELLPKYSDTQRKTIETQALACIFRTLLAQSDQGKVKASFQVLVMFFSKNVISLEQFVDCLLAFEGRPLVADANSSKDLVLRNFTRKLFDWVQYQDSAPAAGQAICALLQCVDDVNNRVKVTEDSSTPLPFWVEPLLASLRDHPESLLNLRYHVFPTLFTMDIQDYICFLNHIGLHKLFAGAKFEGVITSSSGEEYIFRNLLYAALQVGKETGFVLDICEGLHHC
jgi:hypothetical protein